jgi:hypothetical protein
MEELLPVFENLDITESTKKSHLYTFKKIQSIADITKPLHTFSFEDILWLMDQDKTLSESYKRKIICLFVIIKNYYDPTDIALPLLREHINEVTDKISDKRVEDFKTEDTNQYDAIDQWIQTLDNPQKYIMNYIIFYLNTRNLDLIAKIIHDIDYDTTQDDSINYLVLYPDHVKFIRNVYKTKGSYGQKTNLIYDNKFLNLIKQIKHNTFLLNNNRDTIHQMVKRRTYNNMTETEYLHNVIQKYKSNANKLFEIEENRGSNIRNLLTNYNSDFLNGQSSSSLVNK